MVEVTIDGETQTVPPHMSATFELESDQPVRVTTKTARGETIEVFDGPDSEPFATYVYNVAQAAALVRWHAVYGAGAPTPEESLGAPRWYTVDEDFVLTEPPEQIETRGGTETRSVLSAATAPEFTPTAVLGYVTAPAEARKLVEAHLRWEADGALVLSEWAGVVPTMRALRPVLARRAARTPGDVMLARALWSASTPPERDALCTRHRANASAHPEDGDAVYLATRCIEDDREPAEAFLVGYDAHPTNAYLAFVSAGTLASRARWVESLRAYAVAIEGLPATELRAGVIRDALRTHRFARAIGDTTIDPVWSPPGLESEPSYQLLAKVESDAPSLDEPPFVKAYRALRSGNVDDALRIFGDHDPNLVAFAAASENASDALRARALSLAPSELGVNALSALAAMAIRDHEDPRRYFAEMDVQRGGFGIDGLEVAFADGPTEARAARIAELARTLEVADRGRVYVMGVVVLGSDAPDAWRDMARAALFAFERPFIR